MIRCSGDWNAAAEQIIDRASDRAGSSSPHTSTRSKARRSIEAGRSGCSRCTTRSRCSAEAAAGSTSSMGALSGGTSSSGERLGAEPVAHVQEVRVGRAVLPHPRAVLRQRGQRRRVGVVPGEGATLLVGGVAGDLADVGEVAEVLRARPGHLLLALLTLPVDLHEDEAERGEEEHAGRDEAGAAADAGPPVLPIVATSTMEPRLPSIGMAFIATPPAPSLGWICGGGCSTSWPLGISGSSTRPPRSVVPTWLVLTCAQTSTVDRSASRNRPSRVVTPTIGSHTHCGDRRD